jgi:hypothetical protein
LYSKYSVLYDFPRSTRLLCWSLQQKIENDKHSTVVEKFEMQGS